MSARLIDAVRAALDEQAVTVSGSAAAARVLLRLADSLRQTLHQRDQIFDEVERMLEVHHLAEGLTPMPGIDVRLGARILLEVGDVAAFKPQATSPPTTGSPAAIICLTRRRADVLHAMLRTNTSSAPKKPPRNRPYGLTKPIGIPPTAPTPWRSSPPNTRSTIPLSRRPPKQPVSATRRI